MSNPTEEFEARLRRMQPRRISTRMHDAIEERLTPRSAKRDWPMLWAIGSGLAAACVIVAMLIEQTPPEHSRQFSEPVLVATPHEPPPIYAFNFATNSWPDDSRRVR